MSAKGWLLQRLPSTTFERCSCLLRSHCTFARRRLFSRKPCTALACFLNIHSPRCHRVCQRRSQPRSLQRRCDGEVSFTPALSLAPSSDTHITILSAVHSNLCMLRGELMESVSSVQCEGSAVLLLLPSVQSPLSPPPQPLTPVAEQAQQRAASDTRARDSDHAMRVALMRGSVDVLSCCMVPSLRHPSLTSAATERSGLEVTTAHATAFISRMPSHPQRA